MRQEESQKEKVESSDEEWEEIGVPKEWREPLNKLGYLTIEDLKTVEKHTKLHQEMMGYRKKNKLDIGTVSPDVVKEWLEAGSEKQKKFLKPLGRVLKRQKKT